MANIKSLFHTEGNPFWFKTKDSGPGDLGTMLDKWSNLRGVTCDGAIAGLKLDGTGNVATLEFKTIEGTVYMVLTDCAGTELARFVEV